MAAMGATRMSHPRVVIAALCLACLAGGSAAAAYTNHTVGGDSGWFFNVTTNTSSANYSSWAASQTFNLGDSLIFNTNSNQTVIQTYNLTTYQACSMNDASDTDTSQYNGGNTAYGQAMTVPVPLTIEGPNYFFSDADDGIQCLDGMRFEIIVNHGSGLPPSLSQPPPPPYKEPPSASTPQSTPVTTVSPSGNGGFAIDGNSNMAVMLIVVVLCLIQLVV